MKDNSNIFGSLIWVLQIVLIILKLANVIKWSWLIVLFPLEFQIALLLLIFIVAVIVTAIDDKD